MGHKPKTTYCIKQQTAGQGLAEAEVLVLQCGHAQDALSAAGTSSSTHRATHPTSPKSLPLTCQNNTIQVPVPLTGVCTVLMGGGNCRGRSSSLHFAVNFLD